MFFTVPKIYERNEEHVDKAFSNLNEKRKIVLERSLNSLSNGLVFVKSKVFKKAEKQD